MAAAPASFWMFLVNKGVCPSLEKKSPRPASLSLTTLGSKLICSGAEATSVAFSMMRATVIMPCALVSTCGGRKRTTALPAGWGGAGGPPAGAVAGGAVMGGAVAGGTRPGADIGGAVIGGAVMGGTIPGAPAGIESTAVGGIAGLTAGFAGAGSSFFAGATAGFAAAGAAPAWRP